MTKQEVFNKVWNHIIAQGTPSLDDRGYCSYRGPNGLKCAAGIFLTDEQAIELDQGDAGWGEACYVIFPELEVLPVELINELQGVHDTASGLNDEDFIKSFKRNATCVAVLHNLTVPESV